MSDAPQPQPEAPKFDPSAEHQQRPKLRRVRGFPLPARTPDGTEVTLLGLADAQQISDKVIATNPAYQAVLPLMDGTRDLDQIASEIGRGLTREMLEPLVAQLDGALLLQGPGFEAALVEHRAKFDSSDTLPPGATAQFADALVAQAVGGQPTEEQRSEQGPDKLAEAIDKWMEQVTEQFKRPPFETLPKAIIAPHVDYPRGWINYAAVWSRMRGLDRPDRVVVLATNHFGTATGVCGCDKGYESPLGVCPADEGLIAAVRARLGEEGSERLFANRYDHEAEHSVELQIPWIQKVFGVDASGRGVPVFGALIHDPTVNNGASYDGEGLDLDSFVEAMKGALGELGGRTLIVSSADLSHCGPAFGDQQGTAGEDEAAKAFRDKVAKHDQEMLEFVRNRQPGDLVGTLAWQQNPTRWCSIGNIVAAMQIAEPESVEIMSYLASIDPQGTSLVSCAAVAMS